MKTRLFFGLTVLVAANLAHATDEFLPQPDMAMAAIGEHPAVAAAEAELSVAAAEARLLKSGDHEFHLTGSYIRRDIKGSGSFNEWDTSISRAIRLPGKAAADRKIGALGIEVAENARDDARHQVALLLKDYWFEWLDASLQLAIDDQAAQSYQRELDQVMRKHALKEAALIDVEAAKSAQATAVAARLKSAARRLEAERAIQSMFPGLKLPVQTPDVSAPTESEYGFDTWRELILTRSHEIRMAERYAEQQMAAARRSRLDRIADPTVGVRFFSERGGEEQGVGVLFSVPFGTAQRGAKSDAQRGRALAAEAQALEVRRQVNEVANRDVTRAETGLEVWRRAAEALRASEQVIDRLRRAVVLGERDMSELLRAMAQHYDVARQEATARVAAQDAMTQLRIDSHEIWVAAHHDHEDQN